MAYLNSVSIIGNLGHDARYSVSQTSGMKKATLSVAVTKRYRDNKGEEKENTNWFPVVAFGKLADVINQLALKKGTCVYVGGEMNFRTYDDENGNKKQVYELVASTIQVLSQKAQQVQEQTQAGVTADEDLPF